MRITVKTKIWMTVLTVVMMFALFILFYFPLQQERLLLKNFNNEVQTFANTVALGVKIAITEQNFEGIQTAMDFVKEDPHLRYVSMLQADTLWNENRTSFTVEKTVFKTYPEEVKVDPAATSNDSIIVKTAPFVTPMMNGEIMLGFSTSEIVQSKKQIRATSLIVSTLVFVVGIIIGFWLGRNISVPVLALRDAAIKVGEGDLSQRVECRTSDEIGELGMAFNKMVDDLCKARQEVEERTNELIIEKKKSDELLEDLQKTLIDLRETQEQLIRHEKLASIGQLTKGIMDRIQNPLNYINNFSMISKEMLGETKEALEPAKAAIDKGKFADITDLLQMVEANMIKINEHGTSASRIIKEMGRLLNGKSSNFIETDINTLIESSMNVALLEAKGEHPEFDVKVITDFDQQNQKIKILPTEMSSVIANLMSNAFFAVHEKSQLAADYKPEIMVKTTFFDSMLEIRVKDNGKGIPKSEISHIFSPFFTTKPTSKGTGLGLYISQDIIKTHKGNITVDTKEREFTEFTINLPLT